MFCAIEAYAARQWDIHQFLGRWFRKPHNFLLTLQACDGIISGSEALQFLQAGERHFRGEDLDIFVPPHGLLTMGRYVKRAGFLFQPASDTRPSFDAAALMLTSTWKDDIDKRRLGWSRSHSYSPSTFSFVRPAPAAKCGGALQGTKLQIIAVNGHPVEYIVNNFHSSKSSDTYAAAMCPDLFLQRES